MLWRQIDEVTIGKIKINLYYLLLTYTIMGPLKAIRYAKLNYTKRKR